jgi:two-component system chemotaxis response regulator CheY
MMTKILVVDDSMMVREQVAATLREVGFEVIEAHDGFDALVKLHEAPDTALIVLDVNMPNMNGVQLLQKLRVSEQLRHYPVVMLTTEGHPDLMREAKALGAKGWIIKPFKPPLLVAAVRKLTAPAA